MIASLFSPLTIAVEPDGFAPGVAAGEQQIHAWQYDEYDNGYVSRCGISLFDTVASPEQPDLPRCSRCWPAPGQNVLLPGDAPLSSTERQALATHEATVQAGVDTFVAVGLAMLAINRDRLYRATHRSFDAYLTERWPQFGSIRQVYRLMDAAEVVESVTNWSETNGLALLPPANEAQARPLAQLPDEQRGPIYAEAVETAPGGKVTAKHIEQAVDRALGKPETISPDLMARLTAIGGKIDRSEVVGGVTVHHYSRKNARFVITHNDLEATIAMLEKAEATPQPKPQQLAEGRPTLPDPPFGWNWERLASGTCRLSCAGLYATSTAWVPEADRDAVAMILAQAKQKARAHGVEAARAYEPSNEELWHWQDRAKALGWHLMFYNPEFEPQEEPYRLIAAGDVRSFASWSEVCAAIVILEDIAAAAHPDPDRGALITRAQFLGLETSPSDQGLLLWWPHEDPATLSPFAWDAVATWLDEFGPDGAAEQGADKIESDDWYSPAWLVEAARQVLGGIELDPASCDAAQKVVQAGAYFTKADDGLAISWFAETVWLNPPYSQPLPWIQKLLRAFDGDDVEAALVLVNLTGAAEWARLLWHRDFPVCVFDKRVGFWRPSGETKGGDRDQMAVLVCGPHDPRRERFEAIFSAYGAIR